MSDAIHWLKKGLIEKTIKVISNKVLSHRAKGRKLKIENGELRMESWELKIENWEWKVENGKLRIENGKLRMEN